MYTGKTMGGTFFFLVNFSSALYYLNAWTRLNELSQLWAPGIILQPRPQGTFHWHQRPGDEVDNLSAPALG